MVFNEEIVCRITAFFLPFFICLPFLSYPQQSKLSKNVNALSEYLASDEYHSLKNDIGDLPALDSAYIKAVQLSDSDLSEALLTLTFATVPYREIPLVIPVFGFTVTYPLIAAEEEIFRRKNKNLPRFIFFDSPVSENSDIDKPAHFFGSAFLSYTSNIFDLGNLIGYFVEAFEEDFKIQSKIDERDLMTNRLGNLFGIFLKNNHRILPSWILLSVTFMKMRF